MYKLLYLGNNNIFIISLLFHRYNNLYTNYFLNFKLLNTKSSRYYKSSFKGTTSWNSLCLNKLLFKKRYIKNLQKIIKKNIFYQNMKIN